MSLLEVYYESIGSLLEVYLMSIGSLMKVYYDDLAKCYGLTEPQTDIVTTKACYSQAPIKSSLFLD